MHGETDGIDGELGTAVVVGIRDGSAYLLTANHVVVRKCRPEIGVLHQGELSQKTTRNKNYGISRLPCTPSRHGHCESQLGESQAIQS